MKVHELVEILKMCEPNAEVIVGSHTLKHPSCKEPIGTWPAFAIDVGEFVHGGPLGDQNHWVKIVASDAWGCCIFEKKNIRSLPGDIRAVRGVMADPHNDPEWYTRHLPTCGTSFRGCDPECPKELAEQAMRP
jgi:hypothetical protein